MENREKPADPRTTEGSQNRRRDQKAEGPGNIQRDEKTEDLAKMGTADRFGVLGGSLWDKQLHKAPGFREESEGIEKGRGTGGPKNRNEWEGDG